MAQERDRLPPTELERIYARRIKPDFLGDLALSSSPTALLIGGQPGAGKSYALAQARAQLASSAGSAVILSGDELREYHPYWRANALTDPQAAARTQDDAGKWYARLTNDAIAQRVNIAFETSMRSAGAVLALAERLRGNGYTVFATIVAADRDQSRLATVTRFDVARAAGDVPRFVPAAYHDDAYGRLRDTVGQLEAARSVDELRIITRAGAGVYRNQLKDGTWQRPAKAVELLDAARERPLTARELADNALRWQTLVQRLANDPAVARDVAAQVVAWRNDATARAERDPDARQFVAWGREAEAFRTMNHQKFLREFPQHEQTVNRFRQAVDHFESEYGNQADRDRAIADTRARLADRIAEGRSSTKKITQEKVRDDQRTR
jgi:Zeta toxin